MESDDDFDERIEDDIQSHSHQHAVLFINDNQHNDEPGAVMEVVRTVDATSGINEEEEEEEYLNPLEPIGDIDLEIVGLHCSNNGRSCVSHEICGQHVIVGDVLRLVRTTVTVKGVVEPAVKLVKIIDGVDCCVVGFIPRLQMSLAKVEGNINKFCMVKELYSTSDNSYKRGLSCKNMGMAGVVLLDLIPLNE
jgi:hypothetical protein